MTLLQDVFDPAGWIWKKLARTYPTLKTLVSDARELALKSRDPSTRIKYTYYFKIFPNSDEVVGLFLTYYARSATSLISFFAYAYAIKFAHEVSGFADPVAGRFPRLVISGAKRELSKPPKPKNRSPQR